jgi:hypothetical protein
MPDIWEERILPFLQSQNLSDDQIESLCIKLHHPIADWKVDTIFKWLVDREILIQNASLLVLYPRICHAVLFSIGLLWDSRNNELLNVTNHMAWSQTKYMVRTSDGVLETRECAMNNPSFFLGNQCFWLMKRPYNKTVELHDMANEWGQWCKQRDIQLPRQPYILKELVSSSLYEACFFICIENACLKGMVRIIDKEEKSERPKEWTVIKHGADIFPPYFYTADAESTWNTLAFGKGKPQLMPWRDGLNNGDVFVDIRTVIISDRASYLNLQSEIEAFTNVTA